MAMYYLNNDGSVTKKKKNNNDVQSSGGFGAKQEITLPTSNTEKNKKWYEQIIEKPKENNIIKNIIGTGIDLGQHFVRGAQNITESAIDLPVNGASIVANKLGFKDTAQNLRNFAQKDLIKENDLVNKTILNTNPITAPINLVSKGINNLSNGYQAGDLLNTISPLGKTETLSNKMNELSKNNSYSGNTLDAVSEGAGYYAGMTALGGLGVPWQATAGVTSGASEMNNAFQNGATDEQAIISSLWSAGVEIGTEYLSGGIKLPGTGKTADRMITGLTSKIKNNGVKYLIEGGFNLFGEGAEEVISGIGTAIGQKLTYMKDKDLKELYSSEDALKDFIIGTAVTFATGAANPGTYQNIKTGRSLINGLTVEEQNAVNNAVQEKENELGRRLTNKEYNQVEEQAVEQIQEENTAENINENTNTVDNTNPLENLQQFNQKQQEIKNQQVQEDTNRRINTLEEQLEKQGNRILEESESQREAMIEGFKEYLEEHNITNPTQQDINDSITDIMNYDNDLDFADTARAEQLYNKYVKEYMQENGIPFNNGDSLKQSQLDIIKKSNPMQDDYHTGIRNVEDIKTLEETLNDSDYMDYDEFNPDLTRQDIENAIKSGMITVYSSYPIENGVFVSPSKMEVESYSGNGKIYSKQVPINDIAWIDPTQGQYAKVQSNIPTVRDFNRVNLPTVENKQENRASTFSENLLTFTDKEKFGILRNNNNVIVESKNELKKYVLEAINDNQANKNLYLGVVPKSTINKIINEVTDISAENRANLFDTSKEYQLAVNQEEIRHLHKESLTENDVVNFIDSLDELIANFDKVRYTTYKQNQKGLRFIKNMNDGTHIALEILSKQKGTMRTHTLFLDKADFIANKKRSISPTFDEFNNSPNNTSEMDGGLTPSVNNDNIKDKKSQISLPTQYNMQQKKNNIPTKKENNTKSDKVSMPMATTNDVLRVESKRIAKQINSTGGFDLKQRSWVETSTESDVLKNKVFIEDLDKGMINYIVQSNKKSLDTANNHLDTYGYEKSLDYVNNLLQSDGLPKASDVALMQRMIQEASKRGDVETVQNLIMDTAILGTDLGQATQALSIIQRLTPEGQLKMYTKLVQRAKARGEKSFQSVEITPEMVQNILEAYNKDGTYDQDDLNARVEKFKQDIADQMKSTAGEKIDAWRYLAMLGNPKTHIRNMVSNIAMSGTIKVKNAMARTLETILPVQDRTKTWKKASKDVKDFANQTAIDMKGIITGENKYNEKSAIESKKRTFKSKILEWLSKWNGNLLEGEDWLFSRRAFQSTLQEYLTANGINTYEDIQNNLELVEKAKLYAVEQAEIATFRQYSKLASEINRIERNNKLAKYPLKAVLPFKKTPINVAKAGAKYSPLGLIKNISYDAYQLKKGNINASQFIDNLSQGLTGTSLTLLGYALAKAGILSGSGDDDKEAKYDSQLGKQNYALNIGGKSYSISWLSPVAMPLLVGSNAYEKLEEGEGWNPDIVADTLAETLDPLSEMSFVSSLTDVLTSYNTGSAQMIKDIGTTAGQSYVLQFFPTLFSQMASTLDDKKRSTKVSNNSTFKIGEETVRKIMYKIPGLRNQLEVATDIWGNEKEQSSNIMERAFESFLAPYSKTKDISTDLDKEIKRVYNETGENGVIPGIPYAYTKYGGETYKMSANEYTDFKKTYGQTANNTLNRLINSESYQNASNEDKAKMIDNVYDYARAKANEEYFDSNDIEYSNQLLDKIDTLSKNYNINASTYFANKNEYDYAYQNPDKYSVIKQIATYDKYTTYKNKITDIRNNTTNDKDETIKYINSLNMSVPQKAIFIKQYYKSFTNYDKDIIKYINNQNLTVKEKEQILTQLGFTVKDGRVY